MKSIAPWRSALARSLHLNRALAYARYFQLATVTPEGQPKNRTVVFRGFLPDGDQLMAITDHRSAKIYQIEHNPRAEICWYFPKTREQFRLSGTLSVVDSQFSKANWVLAYEQTWQNLSEAARAQFFGLAPGQPVPLETLPAINGNLETMPPTFRLLVFDVQAVDHLDLRSHPHGRQRYWLGSEHQWHQETLTP